MCWSFFPGLVYLELHSSITCLSCFFIKGTVTVTHFLMLQLLLRQIIEAFALASRKRVHRQSPYKLRLLLPLPIFLSRSRARASSSSCSRSIFRHPSFVCRGCYVGVSNSAVASTITIAIAGARDADFRGGLPCFCVFAQLLQPVESDADAQRSAIQHQEQAVRYGSTYVGRIKSYLSLPRERGKTLASEDK